MRKFIRDDEKIINDISEKISYRLHIFSSIYMTYLSFLSTLHKDVTEGVKWAPKTEGKNTLFKIAFDIVTTSLKKQYRYDDFDYDDIHFNHNDLLYIIRTNCELGNILLVCADDYLFENDSEYNINVFMRNTIYKCNDKKINTIVFVPLLENANYEKYLFLKFKDFFPGKEKELYDSCVRYFDKDIFSRYLDEPTKINIMSISEYISYINGIDVRSLELIFNEIELLTDHLADEKIGLLFAEYKDFFFELFKISSNINCKTNYNIEEEKLTLNFFGHNQTYDEYDNANINSIVDDIIANEANKNIDLLKETNVYRLLMTSEYLILQYGGIKDFDNTFMVSGYFKAIELLLYKVLNKYYNNVNFGDKYGHINEKLEIGKMNEMIALLICNGLIDKCYGNELFEKIEKWKEARNEYFHKHVLAAEDCIDIKNLTCELIFYIIGILPVRKSLKCKLEITENLYYYNNGERKIKLKYLNNNFNN